MVQVTAPAKINLTLDVLGLRSDGYHDIKSVMHQVSLYDTITIKRNGSGIDLQSNSPQLPSGEANLAYRAAQLVLDKFGIKEGIRINIEKKIPIAAGLAGGSTNAAAVIEGINSAFELGLDLEQMCTLGLSLGSDIPFCLTGGTALVTGRGENVCSIDNQIDFSLVLVNPGFAVSTSEIYRLLDDEKTFSRPDSDLVISGLESGDYNQVINGMGNVMETVTCKLHPAVAAIKDKLVKSGALKALMSGSGPTVFGLYESLDKAVEAVEIMGDTFPFVYACSTYRL